MAGRRIVIGGGPRVGKTTLADEIDASARHADDVIDMGWSAASAEVARWMTDPGPWVIEGTATVRALRKALASSSDAPCDTLIWLREPRVPRQPEQEPMAAQCETFLAEIRGELVARGVEIEER
jgi:adenylate kinase family enzyme